MDRIIINIKNKIDIFFKEESGMGVIEVILIILVLVGLALVFKNQISGVADGIFISIKNQVKKF